MSTQEVNLRSSLSGGFYELTLISGIREVDFEWFSTSGETFRFGGSVARSSARKFEIWMTTSQSSFGFKVGPCLSSRYLTVFK